MNRDPDGFYARLGVTPDASHTEIRAAYRAKAAGPATPDVVVLHEAYDALRDPDCRAAYDARGFRHAAAERVEPARCARCGVVSAQPRYAVFPRVTSMLVLCRHSASQGVRCPACAAHEAGRAALWTVLIGWWSAPGLLRSPGKIRANLRGGEMPAEANAALLARQCLAFARRGEPKLAAACLRQAEAFAQGEDVDLLAQLRRGLRLPDAAVKDAWAPARPGLLWARTAPLIVGLAAVAWWVSPPLRLPHPADSTDGGRGSRAVGAVVPPPRMADTDRHRDAGAVAPPTPDLALEAAAQPRRVPQADAPAADRSASEAAAPPRPAPRYAYILPGRGEAILQRGAEAGPAQPVRLPTFATVEILGLAADPAYAEIRTGAGELGRVPAARLGPGDGAEAQRRWCEDGVGMPPVHNEVALQRRGGPHRITINNYGDRWAAAKVRDEGHQTVLSVFVGPQSTAEVKNVPSGRFRLEYALGERWSRRCGRFLDGARTQRFPDFTEFPARQPEAQRYITQHATYTITPVFGGNVRAQDVPADEFEAE